VLGSLFLQRPKNKVLSTKFLGVRFVYIHPLRTLHSVVPHPGGSDPAAAGQGGRGRAFLEHDLEHRFRPARDCKLVGQDHNRRRRRVHADRIDTRFAAIHRLALDPGVDTRKRSSHCAESIADSGSITRRITSCPRDITRRTGSITCGNEIAAATRFAVL